MPIPDFTDYGLLPQGVHDCTVEEAGQFLCSNERRKEIWAGLLDFFQWIMQFPRPDAIFVDGSYVTDKPLPGDVDVIVDVTTCAVADQQLWMNAWAQNRDYAKAQFSVDFYPIVVGQDHDFSAFFQYIRVDEALRRGVSLTTRKGILRVQP